MPLPFGKIYLFGFQSGVLNRSRKEARQKIEEENNINSDVADTRALVNALENSHDSNET